VPPSPPDAARSRRPQPRHLVITAVGAVAVLAAAIVVATVDDAPDPTADCRSFVPVRISSSTEKDNLLADIAKEYNKSGRTFGDGRCGEITVNGLSSGAAELALSQGWEQARTGLPRPQVWTPTSSLWYGLLREAGKSDVVVDDLPSITASTLTIAMPKRPADVLAQHGKLPRQWADIHELTAPDWNWTTYGHPEWGEFALGRDNAHVSTSGLAATVATYHAAVQQADLPGITAETVQDAEVVPFVRQIESSVQRYGNDAVDFMEAIHAAEQEPSKPYRPYIDAVVVQEQMAYMYNCGAPGGDREKLAACAPADPDNRLTVVHPSDGTLLLDHPYYLMDGISTNQRAAAEDFYDYLGESAQQNRFLSAGFRDPQHPETPTPQLVDTIGVDSNQHLKFVAPPDSSAMATMLQSWDDVRRNANVLFVVDVSGSMRDVVPDPNEPDPNKHKSKLQLLQAAARHGLGVLHREDRVGLLAFSDQPQTPLAAATLNDGMTPLLNAIDALKPSGNTALYQAVTQSANLMSETFDPDRINAIVLLSDGRNHPPDDRAREQMFQALSVNKENPIRIFTVAYGADDVDPETLEEIARQTKGGAYQASNPLAIDEVLVDVFLNF
jgi:Ca-activated chloride channel homolog